MEGVIIWEALQACQFSDCNNPPALIMELSSWHLGIKDTIESVESTMNFLLK